MVLDHVGFDLQPGEIIGLIGPSGAGKSTMIKNYARNGKRRIAVSGF